MATSFTNVTRQYRDLDLNFNIHPIRKDINKNVGDMAVINSIKNLISTNNYERLFNPIFGGNIRAMLFENMDPVTALRMEKEIVNMIQNYEPRAILSSVTIIPQYENNAYDVKIRFRIVNRQDPIQISFQLERLR
jgi:phage baseplate assembly protein W